MEQPVSKALALDPNELTALNLRAIQLIESRKLKEAEAIIARISPATVFDHSVLNTIGMLRLEQGNYSDAIVFFERVVELNRAEAVFIYNLALSYELVGRCLEARTAWSTFLGLSNDPARLAVVRERLQRNFATEGGRCFGVTQ